MRSSSRKTRATSIASPRTSPASTFSPSSGQRRPAPGRRRPTASSDEELVRLPDLPERPPRPPTNEDLVVALVRHRQRRREARHLAHVLELALEALLAEADGDHDLRRRIAVAPRVVGVVRGDHARRGAGRREEVDRARLAVVARQDRRARAILRRQAGEDAANLVAHLAPAEAIGEKLRQRAELLFLRGGRMLSEAAPVGDVRVRREDGQREREAHPREAYDG